MCKGERIIFELCTLSKRCQKKKKRQHKNKNCRISQSERKKKEENDQFITENIGEKKI